MPVLWLATVLLVHVNVISACNISSTFKETDPGTLKGIYCSTQLTRMKKGNFDEQKFFGFYRKTYNENHMCYYEKMNDDLVALASLSGGKMYTIGNLSCPGDFGEADGYCYKVVTTLQNHDAHKSGCIGIGGYLATVKTAHEQTFFVQVLKDSGFTANAVYIGLYDATASAGVSNFRWLIDNSLVSYHNVGNLGSLRGGDQCMYVFTVSGATWAVGDWSDSPCNSNKGAMCEANKGTH